MNAKDFSREWEKWSSDNGLRGITTIDGNVVYGDSYYVDWFMHEKVVYVHCGEKLVSVLKLKSIFKVEG